jgi:hypothetical protein
MDSHPSKLETEIDELQKGFMGSILGAIIYILPFIILL